MFEGAQNDALDELMTMIGLEDVKRQFLEIKIKIDIAARQGVDVKRERFGAALLGNPGTGMSLPRSKVPSQSKVREAKLLWLAFTPGF